MSFLEESYKIFTELWPYENFLIFPLKPFSHCSCSYLCQPPVHQSHPPVTNSSANLRQPPLWEPLHPLSLCLSSHSKSPMSDGVPFLLGIIFFICLFLLKVALRNSSSTMEQILINNLLFVGICLLHIEIM